MPPTDLSKARTQGPRFRSAVSLSPQRRLIAGIHQPVTGSDSAQGYDSGAEKKRRQPETERGNTKGEEGKRPPARFAHSSVFRFPEVLLPNSGHVPVVGGGRNRGLTPRSAPLYARVASASNRLGRRRSEVATELPQGDQGGGRCARPCPPNSLYATDILLLAGLNSELTAPEQKTLHNAPTADASVLYRSTNALPSCCKLPVLPSFSSFSH